MALESRLDDDRARQDPHAFLPGLAMRLKHQGVYRLLERLRSQGIEGEDLRLRFLAELERASQETSIFAHEGRHAIDRIAGNSWSRELEFTAKLSELALAPEPRLAFGGILDDNTPHGRANLKVIRGLVAWIGGARRGDRRFRS